MLNQRNSKGTATKHPIAKSVDKRKAQSDPNRKKKYKERLVTYLRLRNILRQQELCAMIWQIKLDFIILKYQHDASSKRGLS
jgi:hypothetical protein